MLKASRNSPVPISTARRSINWSSTISSIQLTISMAESLYDKHGTSEEFSGPYCDVCYEAKKLDARPDGYCHECYHCLCKDCLFVHKSLPATKDHAIRTGDDMPKSQADKPPRFENCDDHHHVKKDQYCSEHRVLLCWLCAPLNHKDCHVESVEFAVKDIPSSEINLLYKSLGDFKTQLMSAESRIESNVSDLIEQKNNILNEIQEIYDKTMSKINKLFQDLKSDLESKYQCQSSDLTRYQEKIKDVTVKLESIIYDIGILKGRIIDTEVFLKVQNMLKNLDKYNMNVSTVNQMTTRKLLNFAPDKTINNFLSSFFTMGTISLEESNHDVTISIPDLMFPSSPDKPSQASAAEYQPSRNTKPISVIQAQKHTKYNIKLRDDKELCWITGLSITLDGRRLLADSNNSKIKMISRKMKIISSLSLPVAPLDIAVTGDREAVVNGYGESVLFILDVSDKQMSIRRTVELSYGVYGIATYKDKLVVTSLRPSPASVKLIDHSGIVYWSTSTDQQGQRLFSVPLYVSCYDDGRSSTVIVTDNSNDTLTLLNSNTGDFIRRHQVEAGKRPKGVTTDTAGNVIVCYRETDEVAVLSRDISEEKILLTRHDGISGSPQAIVYDADDHKLLVSYRNHSGVFSFVAQMYRFPKNGCNVVDCFHLP